MEPLTLKTRAQMAEVAVRLEQAGAGHHVPLIRAAMAGALRFAVISPGSALPLRLLDMARDSRPLAVILADDGDKPTGPDGFPQARRLLRWAASIFIHATGGQPIHYAAAAQVTMLVRRFLLIETNTAHEAEWCDLRRAVAPRTPGVVLTVPPGAPPHPHLAVPAGEVVQ
ncbi:MAG: hypothetical protein IRY87_36020 [Acetobacteraceae bacterium]|nr:hypothetical protein [Acetobacteraceae bacterium]